MATPAVDKVEDTINPTPTQQWQSGNWVATSPSYGIVRRYQRKRPASVETVKRPDYSRPPADWLSQQFQAVGAWGTVSYILNGTPYQRYHDGCVCYPPNYTNSFFANYSWDDRLRQLATQKALAKLKDSKVNLGVALAEARKTAELLANTSQTISQQLDEFMSRNWKKLGKMNSWKKVPARYLELCYGWTPLLSDVYGSCEAIAYRQALGYPLSLCVRAQANGSQDWSQVVPMVGSFGQCVWQGTSEESCKVSFTYDVPNTFLREFSTLGLTNPAVVAWELVPYSFVLDWLVPIGSWLDLLDAGAFLEYREGSRTCFVRFEDAQLTGQTLGPNIAFGEYDLSRAGRINAVRMQRIVMGSPGWYGLPSLRSPLSLDKAAKGLALLTQVLKRWA